MEIKKFSIDQKDANSFFQKSLKKQTMLHIQEKMEPSKCYALQQMQQMVVKTIDAEDFIAMADYFQGLSDMIHRILKKNVTVLDEEILTTEEAAKKLRMSTKTLLNKYVHTNIIKATPTGKGYIFKLSDLVNFMK